MRVGKEPREIHRDSIYGINFYFSSYRLFYAIREIGGKNRGKRKMCLAKTKRKDRVTFW